MRNSFSNPTDYFASLLGDFPDAGQKKPQPRRTTVVTPATVERVRAERAEDVFAAERESLEAEIEKLNAVVEELAKDLAAAQQALEDEKAAKPPPPPSPDPALLEQIAAKDRELESLHGEAAAKDREIERLQTLLAEAQRTSLSSTVLLEKPDGISEKFTGEVREHLLETLADAQDAADAGGRDRRARILEAILYANSRTGELARRRDAVKQIMKDAGSSIDDSTITALKKLGFRYISGSNHHKLDYAGIRFPVAKTPSDRRSCLNSAAEICTRVF
jgi:chromosome segregation ATPase